VVVVTRGDARLPLIYSAGTFFASHHLTGTDTPYPDMPYHLALIGELINHVPPQVPFVSGMPLAYHWFFYADAAATSWATGISPLTLLYRLSMLPMFVGFVALTATTAQRLTGRMSSGPIAVAIALFGVAAAPYRWVGTPVFNTQTLAVTWISPTNLFGLAIFAAVLLTVVDLLRADASVRRRYWLLLGLLVAGAAGAKASLLPLLIVGLLAVIAGFAVGRRRIHRHAMVALLVAGIGFLLATILIYLGSTRGLVIGLDSLRSFPVVGVTSAGQANGISSLVLPSASFLVAVVLWSFMWAGASGLLVRRQGQQVDPGILLLLGVCTAGLGAATVFSYPGLSQAYYLTAAAGAFGVIVTAGVARLVPSRAQYLRLIICVAAAAVLGAAVVLVIRKLGPAAAPSLSSESLLRILVLVVLPVLAMAIVAATAFIVLRLLAPRMAVLEGAVPLLVVALVMGFSLPNVATVVASPFTGPPMYSITVPSAGIDAARWIRDHTAIDDLVATNLHCDSPTTDYTSCNPTSFWVSAYSERHVLVEGWAYTTKSVTLGPGVVAPFWDQELLAANDSAFTDPSAAADARLRDEYGVRWLLADLTGANSDSIGRFAQLRFREGAFAVYELTGS